MADGKGRFRVLKAAAKRADDPRTGKEAEGKTAGTNKGMYLPQLADPFTVANLYHLNYWAHACDDAIADGIAGAEVEAIFKGKNPEDKADEAKLALMDKFLTTDTRSFMTIGERLGRLGLDYSVVGIMAIEIGRGADRLPAAWYHVPAATIRELKDGSGYDQVDVAGKVVQHFAAYQPGGNKGGLPELIVIKKYDPAAQYQNSTDASCLASTAERMTAQDEYNSKLLRKGGMVPLLLILKDALGDDQFSRLQEYLDELEGGTTARMMGLVEGVGEGGRLEKLVQDFTDASFKEGENLLRERTLAVKKVPPSKLGLPVVNYAVAQIEDATFRHKVTAKVLRLIFHRLNIVADEVVPEEGYAYEAKPETLIDLQQIAQAVNLLVNNGTLSRNEARVRLGEKGMGDEGNIRTIQSPTGLTILSAALEAGGTPTLGRMIDQAIEARRILSGQEREAHED